MTVRAYNPTNSPVVIDEAGHTLPGGDWGDVDPEDEVGKTALDLLVVEEPEAKQKPPPEPPDPQGPGGGTPPPKTTSSRSARAGEGKQS